MSQHAVFAHMADPNSHDHAPDGVERIDTHAAVVFLSGDYAYKIKRAVRLPYLDFSTLEKRRAVCEREVEINRRTAPDIYLGVLPIVRTCDGLLAIAGKGEPVEWAIKMRRFDQAELFDRLARAGALPLEMMQPLAREVADLHSGERPQRSRDGAKMMKQVIEPVLTSLGGDPAVLNKSEVADYAADARRELRAQSSLLRARAGQGYVRHCHGDLHLQNIVRIDGTPVLFDAIEFDERIATIDTLYDVAFLLMDLWHRDLRAHANLLLNAYLAQTGQDRPVVSLRGLALLPLFLSVRASVRAMVGLDRLPFTKKAGQKAARDDVAVYFRMAREFLQPQAPQLIVIGGLSGTGKSTLAVALAPAVGAAPGAVVFRSDIERKRLAGVGETTRLDAAQYTAAATGRVYRALAAKAKAALGAGRTVVVDAVFARPDQRARIEQIAGDAGAPFAGLWLEAPDRAMVERVEARKGDASDANARVVTEQLTYDTGPIAWHHVDAGGSPEDVHLRAMEVLKALR